MHRNQRMLKIPVRKQPKKIMNKQIKFVRKAQRKCKEYLQQKASQV